MVRYGAYQPPRGPNSEIGVALITPSCRLAPHRGAGASKNRATSASVHCQLGPGEVQMRARTETIELGERVSRALIMENSGPARRRIWWIVSSAVLAPLSGPQAA